MCGRFTLATPADDLVETFEVPSLTFDYVPRFNIAPGQSCPVIAEDARGRRMGLLDWGFVPAWKVSPGRGFINARAETVATRSSFKEAFRRRRCLVPADGFFEWTKAKDPFWIYPVDGRPVSFAGIWETWSTDGAEPRHTFAIITTQANDDVHDIHDRMPVVIAVPERTSWLDRNSPLADVARLLRRAPAGTFAYHAVDSRVNDVTQDESGVIRPRVESASGL
jgi:putative SOS response-associated peptidase YedK